MSDEEREALLKEVERLITARLAQGEYRFRVPPESVRLLEIIYELSDAAPKLLAECRRLAGNVAAMRSALKRHGRHIACKAFPATSEEQIARDCDCGLQAALSPAADRGEVSGGPES